MYRWEKLQLPFSLRDDSLFFVKSLREIHTQLVDGRVVERSTIALLAKSPIRSPSKCTTSPARSLLLPFVLQGSIPLEIKGVVMHLRDLPCQDIELPMEMDPMVLRRAGETLSHLLVHVTECTRHVVPSELEGEA
jgi:hypothetical protein